MRNDAYANTHRLMTSRGDLPLRPPAVKNTNPVSAMRTAAISAVMMIWSFRSARRSPQPGIGLVCMVSDQDQVPSRDIRCGPGHQASTVDTATERAGTGPAGPLPDLRSPPPMATRMPLPVVSATPPAARRPASRCSSTRHSRRPRPTS
ncbi:hypothetical protein SDC9_105286 [bioreactor metagenome]|uniref:Uncharacterized protein n=1 Tax=bioreactor metagenome TaxID=1076179 RepID=A0A645AYY1_9ZZZZ